MPGLEVLTLGGAELGDNSVRYQLMMSRDPRMDLGFLPPSAQVASELSARMHWTMTQLAKWLAAAH